MNVGRVGVPVPGGRVSITQGNLIAYIGNFLVIF